MNARSILMTTDTAGGIWNFSEELARALEPHGVEICLASMGSGLDSPQKAAIQSLKNVQLHERSCRLEWMRDPWDDLDQAADWLLKLEQQFQPDVIHLNSFSLGAIRWQAPVLITGHSCVYSWYEAVYGTTPPTATWGRYFERVRDGLQHAGLVTAPTQTMLQALLRIYGPFEASSPVPDGRTSNQFLARHREPLILSAGRLWDEAKNIRTLESASPGIPWPIYVAGPTQHPDGGAVRFPELTHLENLPPSELAEWMGRASIYVHPSLYEPFGLAPLEAALAGCCLILSDIPSLREIWDGAALFFPPGDSAALHKAMQHLITHYMHRQHLRDLAHARALEFSPERTAQGYLDLYSSLLEAGALQPVGALS